VSREKYGTDPASILAPRYGITVATLNGILDEQSFLCAICEEPLRGGRYQAIDHDHTSGKVRGVLCASCNTAIGKLKDDPEIIRRAADYVERHKFPN
jgi:hypothetical protein